VNEFASNVERHRRELLLHLLPHARLFAGRRGRGAGNLASRLAVSQLKLVESKIFKSGGVALRYLKQ
jgi:hypothetical protein